MTAALCGPSRGRALLCLTLTTWNQSPTDIKCSAASGFRAFWPSAAVIFLSAATLKMWHMSLGQFCTPPA